jgi:PAS domain S-box-containing protein
VVRSGVPWEGLVNTVELAKILIVDDRPENLLALETVLEPLGQQVIRAHSGEEALRCVLLDDFAVILLDVQLPGLNGFETASILKSRARSRHTPIIFLTAINTEEHFVYEGYSVGAVDYMPKPLQPDVLRSKVGVFVELWRKSREVERQAKLLRESQRRELELRYSLQLQEWEARATQIVETAREAIITFDAERRITLFNRAAEVIFGVSAGSALQRRVEELLHAEMRSEFRDQVALLDTGDDLASLCTLVYTGLRGGTLEFPFEASLSRLVLAGGPVYTLIGRDVSERHRAEQALRRQATELSHAMSRLQTLNDELQRRQVELEEALSARTRFYAAISHEIRTPLNAVLGYCSLLLGDAFGPLNERQHQGVECANRATEHLVELVNDVLNLSKIDAGKSELQLERVAFPALVEDLFVTLRPQAEEHSCELMLVCEAEPGEIWSDPRRIRQILLNLVSNAIKFGMSRPVRVTYSAGTKGAIEIAVTDQGEGIAAEEIPRIFEEFVQLPSAAQAQGTGLGLPISRRLATLLGGSIAVDSTPGKGSTFRLALPSHPPGAVGGGGGVRPEEEEPDRDPDHLPDPGGDPGRNAAPAIARNERH